MKVRKAIIPIAGKGTRFLPATKQMAKEIIPIINVPMIHYVVKEAVDSGIEQIVLVTAYGKEAVENYFDRNFELEAFLEANGKLDLLDLVQNIGKMVEITTVRQKEQLGLGHAVLVAKEIINKGEVFSVLLGDDIIIDGPAPATKQLMDISSNYSDSPVIGVMEIPKEDTCKYGVISGQEITANLFKMDRMVEKPSPAEAPSNLATPGRYILNSEIFDALNLIERGAGGEYQLTDAINLMAGKRDVYAYKFVGDRFDTGNVNGYLDATIEFALRNPELKEYTLKLIKDKVKKYGN